MVYLAVGFWILPKVVRSQLQTRGEELLGRRVEVDRVAFNPLKLALTLEGFRLKEKDGSNFVAWKRLLVDFQLSSLIRGEWRFRQVAMEELQAKIIIDAHGVPNFADIQARFASPAKSAGAPTEPTEPAPARPLVIEDLFLDIKPIAFSDFSRPTAFVTALGPVRVALKDFHTSPNRESAGGITARTEAGEEFVWTGSVILSPLSSRGRIEVRDFSIPKHAPYLHGLAPVVPLSGKLHLSAEYVLTTPKGTFQVGLQKGEATVEKLALASVGSVQPLVKWERIAVNGLSLSTLDRRVHLAALKLDGGLVDVVRDVRGLNLAAWAPAAPASAPQAPLAPTAQNAPFTVALDAFDISGLAVQWLDTTGPAPVRVRLDPISVSIKNLDTANPGAALPVAFSASLGKEGVLRSDGTVALKPLQANLRTTATGLSLAPFSPYLEALSPFQVTEGALSLSAEVAAALPEGQAPVIGARAEVAVDQLSLQRKDSGRRLLHWNRFEVKNIEATTQPALRVVVGNVLLEQPEIDVSIAGDGTLNWAVPANPEPGVRVASAPAPAAPPLSLAVDLVELRGGRVAFQDQSLQPAVHLVLADLNGRVGGLSSANLARADVELGGRFDGGAPFSVKGQINPLSDDVFSDVAVGFQGLDLLPASPYSGKYVGRKLARGNATLDMKVKLSRRTLAVNQTLVLDQLTLGASVPSPDATKLPVGLALALLRDTRGKITLNVPVEGSLDDPQFRVGAVIWGVVRNLLQKAATAPFALLGSMFGGGGDELGWVEFAPGSTFLHERGTGKMETVGRALRERPTLSLDITGHFLADVDAANLREVALRNRLQRALWDELRQAQPEGALPPPDKLEISPEVEGRLLSAFYLAAHGHEMPLTPLPAKTSGEVAAPSVTPPAKPVDDGKKPGLLRRFVRFLAGDENRAPSTAKAVSAGNSKRPAAAIASANATARASTAVVDPNALPPALPPLDQMKARLLEEIPVTDEMLASLGDQRAQALRAHLVNEGKVSPERIFIVPSSPGSTRAELTLK